MSRGRDLPLATAVKLLLVCPLTLLGSSCAHSLSSSWYQLVLPAAWLNCVVGDAAHPRSFSVGWAFMQTLDQNPWSPGSGLRDLCFHSIQGLVAVNQNTVIRSRAIICKPKIFPFYFFLSFFSSFTARCSCKHGCHVCQNLTTLFQITAYLLVKRYLFSVG